MTMPATALNDAVVLPSVIVTEPGIARIVLLLEIETTEPARGADLDKVTVQTLVDPEATAVGAHAKLLTVRGTHAINTLVGIRMK